MPELIWDAKYQDGKRAGPVRIALPFQTVETVNESAQDRQRSLELFSSGREGEWRNRLIWGDKKYVLPSLLAEFAAQVDLIYSDPPVSRRGVKARLTRFALRAIVSGGLGPEGGTTLG